MREFVAEFAGLLGSAKQQAVTQAAGLSKGASLEELIVGGDVALAKVTRLLAAMKDASRPITPTALGTVGRAHLTARLEAAGVDPGSVRYTKTADIDEGLPFVVEVAFGIHADRGDEKPLV